MSIRLEDLPLSDLIAWLELNPPGLPYNALIGKPAASSSLTTYRKATDQPVNTTVAATDLLNGEITVAAGVMGAKGALRLTAWGDWKNASGVGATAPRFQFILGTTTIFDTNALGTTFASATSRVGWRIVVELNNKNATNSQSATFLLNAASANGPAASNGALFVAGEGYYWTTAGNQLLNATAFNTSLVDTTVAQALKLNVINGSASASYETKLAGALVEVL